MTTSLFVLFTQLHQTHSYFHLPTFFHHYANSTEFFIKAGIDFFSLFFCKFQQHSIEPMNLPSLSEAEQPSPHQQYQNL